MTKTGSLLARLSGWQEANIGLAEKIAMKEAAEEIERLIAERDEWRQNCWDRTSEMGELRNRLYEAERRLIRQPSSRAKDGCYCVDKCAAPVVMGRPTPCRDPEKAARFVACSVLEPPERYSPTDSEDVPR